VRIFGQTPSDSDNRGGPTLFLRPLDSGRFAVITKPQRTSDCD
jgi:hypothetical protein